MAITRSAKKALRQSLRRRKRNLIYKNKVKSALKEMKGLVLQKKPEEAKKLLPNVYKILDKATKAGVIKKGAADRKKSRIAKLLKRA